MNHIFKIIWNTVSQCWVAVSELSKSVAKSFQTDKRKRVTTIIGTVFLTGITTNVLAETNVVLDNNGNIVGGKGASAFAGIGKAGDSVVLGNNAKSEGTESIVIGNSATNTGRWSVTLGDQATGNSQYGVTIGERASSGKGSNSVVIGLMAKTSNEKKGGNSQTAVGAASYADGEGASAFGANANATGSTATAIGLATKAIAQSASAFGNSASASAAGASALGVGASARADNSIAIGSAAVTEGRESTALGRRSYAGAQSATALGTLANASAIVSTAVGNGAKASAFQASALGNSAEASGESSMALGTESRASGSDALASGSNSSASSDNAIAIGKDSQSSAINAIAMGESSNASGVSAVVIGTQAKGTHENSVTLGSYSSSVANIFNNTAKTLSSFDDTATSTTINYNGTSSTQTGAVSVGDGKLVRQIQNVGAGRITATSNDAVNGSQLYQAYYNAGFNIQNNGKETSRINTHGKVNFVDGENTKVVVEDGDNAAKIKVNAKDTSASVEAGSDAITVTVGEPTKVTGKDGVTVTTVTNYKVDLSQKTKDEIKNASGRGFNVTASASEGTVVNEVTEETVQSTATKIDKLTLDAGKNIKLTHKKGKVLSVAVSDTPTFTNVTTTGDINVGGTIHAHGGLDVHNNRIVNVADPKDPTDAVNKRYVDNAVKNINNNKVSIKVGASINTRSDVNWGGSIGYQW